MNITLRSEVQDLETKEITEQDSVKGSVSNLFAIYTRKTDAEVKISFEGIAFKNDKSITESIEINMSNEELDSFINSLIELKTNV